MNSAPKIIIIDKDLDTRNTILNLLKNEGYELLTSSIENDAVSMVETHQPDLIILDRIFSEIDGIEIIRKLRSNPATADILIMVYSALASPSDQLLGFEAGADEYLRKPAAASELLARIKALVQHAAFRQQTLSHRNRNVVVKSRQGIMIGILAAKGGVGVSLLATNLGIALQQLSKESVLVADLRPGCSTMAAEMGSPGMVGLERLLLLNPESITADAIESQLHHHKCGVKFLFASPHPGDAQHILADRQLAQITRMLPSISKYTVLDLGSCLTPAITTILGTLPEIIILMEPSPPGLLATRLLLEKIGQTQTNTPSIRIGLSYCAQECDVLSIDQVQVGIRRNISAVLNYSANLILKAQLESTPVILYQPESKLGSEYRSLAKAILNIPD